MYVSGSVVEVFHNAEGTFTGIFFQDVQMRQMYDSFPEVIMADATYKLTDLRMPLFLMIGIDGNGHSQVIAVYMTCNETTTALTHMLEVCLSSLLISAMSQMACQYTVFIPIYASPVCVIYIYIYIILV